MLTRGRILGLAILLVVAWGAYVAWTAVQVRGDLSDAKVAAERFRAHAEDLDHDGPAARRNRTELLRQLQEAAASAHDRTDDLRWQPLTWLPVVGDDARAVEVLSGSLDEVSHEGIPPLLKLYDEMDGLVVDGGVDLDRVEALQAPVAQAATVFARSDKQLAALDAGDLLEPVRGPLLAYADMVSDGANRLATADRALQVAPGMLGAVGPRTYLLVFQNNAEIRGAGGLPGSWAELKAVDGKLHLGRQGAGSDFAQLKKPILPLSKAEQEIYGDQLGEFFVDATFTPDFPRAAELMAARWQREIGPKPDGVISIDPVALSYLMKASGPVHVAGETLTNANVVEALLNRPYLTLDQVRQDAYFRVAAKAVFDQVVGDLSSPTEFLKQAAKAVAERRILVAPFHDDERSALAGRSILGSTTGRTGPSPVVDVALNDTTGSKMSYYLRHSAEITPGGCTNGRQELSGTVTLRQNIDPSVAAELPPSVTGGGNFGTAPGNQFVGVRLYGPTGGTISKVRINGKRVLAEPVELDGRPVVSTFVLLDSTKTETVSWSMVTGAGETGDVRVHVTPGVVPGSRDSVARSAC